MVEHLKPPISRRLTVTTRVSRQRFIPRNVAFVKVKSFPYVRSWTRWLRRSGEVMAKKSKDLATDELLLHRPSLCLPSRASYRRSGKIFSLLSGPRHRYPHLIMQASHSGYVEINTLQAYT
jgi:hypothetical protein